MSLGFFFGALLGINDVFPLPKLAVILLLLLLHLVQIWDICDETKVGVLSQQELYLALGLVGLVQRVSLFQAV